MRYWKLYWARYSDGSPVWKPFYVWAANEQEARARLCVMSYRLASRKFGLA